MSEPRSVMLHETNETVLHVTPHDVAALAELLHADNSVVEDFVQQLPIELVPEWVIRLRDVRVFLHRAERFMESRLIEEKIAGYATLAGEQYVMRSHGRWEIGDVGGFVDALMTNGGLTPRDLGEVVSKDGFRWSAFERFAANVREIVHEFRVRRYGPLHLTKEE